MTAAAEAGLVDHLLATRIAGDVATSREDNLGNITKLLAREPRYTFGLELDRDWSFDGVVLLMARLVGIDPDPKRDTGADRIDPQRCVAALDRMREQIDTVRRSRGSVLLATGHPTGLLALHQQLAAALAADGCRILTPGDDEDVKVEGHRGRVLYVGGVAVLATRAHLLHTHLPEPMQVALAAAGTPPDLVIADHGWAGAAAQAGVPTVGFADCNDPALFVGEAEGKVSVAVPLDDNVPPRHYEPLARHLLGAGGR